MTGNIPGGVQIRTSKLKKLSMDQKQALLIDELKKYNTHVFLAGIIDVIERDFMYSHDDRFACLRFLLEFTYTNKHLAGAEKKIKKIGYIVDLVTELSPYEPLENMFLTYRDGYNVYLDEVHKNRFHYLPKRKVSKRYNTIGKEILDKFDHSIHDFLGFTVNEYYEVISRLVYSSLRNGTNKYAYLENIKNISNYEKIIDLLATKLLSTAIRVYLIGDYVYCIDMIYLEENAYFIMEESINKINNKLFSKISMYKGEYAEKLVFNELMKYSNPVRDVLIGGLQTDAIVLSDNTLLIIEVKAIKYDTDMKERSKSDRNGYKDLKKGINQLYDRVTALDKDIVIRNSKSNECIFSISEKDTVLPIMVTLDHLYELSELNHIDALELKLKMNPVIFNVDDFIAILERIDNITEFFDFLKFRYRLKENNHFIRDNFFSFLVFKKQVISKKNIVPNPITSREIVFKRNFIERYSTKDDR